MSFVYAGQYTLSGIKKFCYSSGQATYRCLFAYIYLLIFLGVNSPVFAQTNNQPYNLLIGPVTLRADAGMTVNYNDNINSAQTGRRNDWIVEPDVNFHGLWQATDLNTLTIDMGVGYQRYLIHPQYSAPVISPNSQALYKIFVGDFRITLQDSLSYQTNPTAVGQLSNIVQFRRFLNTAAVGVDWDIGDLTATLAYNHTNFWVFEPAYSYLDYQSDAVSPQVALQLSKAMQVGFTVSLGSTRYDQTVQNNYTQLMAEPFIMYQISEYLSIRAQAGWELNNYANGGTNGGTNGDTSNTDSFVGNFGITHRVNDALTESLTGGREFLPGITSNYTDRIFVNYTPAWHATSRFDIAPQLWWERLQDSSATVSELSTRFGVNMTIGLKLTEHSTVNLSYNYVRKISNLNSMCYYQDVAGMQFSYQF